MYAWSPCFQSGKTGLAIITIGKTRPALIVVNKSVYVPAAYTFMLACHASVSVFALCTFTLSVFERATV